MLNSKYQFRITDQTHKNKNYESFVSIEILNVALSYDIILQKSKGKNFQ